MLYSFLRDAYLSRIFVVFFNRSESAIMKIKNIAKASLASMVMMLSLNAQAIPSSKIVFPKGSYCSSFTGDVSDGRVFKIYLGAKQELVIRPYEGYVRSVKDSKGRRLADHGDEDYRYYTRSKGEHRITIVGAEHDTIEFCAY